MINIIETSRPDLTPVDLYILTQSPEIKVVKDLEDGSILQVADWCRYEDVKDNGDVVELLSIVTPEKQTYSCQSKTFKKSFFDIAKLMGNNPFAIKKISGETKAGRPFVNCSLSI